MRLVLSVSRSYRFFVINYLRILSIRRKLNFVDKRSIYKSLVKNWFRRSIIVILLEKIFPKKIFFFCPTLYLINNNKIINHFSYKCCKNVRRLNEICFKLNLRRNEVERMREICDHLLRLKVNHLSWFTANPLQIVTRLYSF